MHLLILFLIHCILDLYSYFIHLFIYLRASAKLCFEKCFFFFFYHFLRSSLAVAVVALKVNSSPSCWGPFPPEDDSRRGRGHSSCGCPLSHWWPESRWMSYTLVASQKRKTRTVALWMRRVWMYSTYATGIKGKLHLNLRQQNISDCSVFKPPIISASSSRTDSSQLLTALWDRIQSGFIFGNPVFDCASISPIVVALEISGC